MIILWKGIKIEPVATWHWFPEQERLAASTVARGQFGDSGSSQKKTPPRIYYPRVKPNGRNRPPEHTVGISGCLPLGTGRWSTEKTARVRSNNVGRAEEFYGL
jgi:hypothetical protein